jgi:hypothetical protein
MSPVRLSRTGDREPEDGALPSPEKFNTFNTFNTFAIFVAVGMRTCPLL